MSQIVIENIFFILLLVGLSIPLGKYIYKVMTGQKVFLSRIVSPLERGIYKMMGCASTEEMSAKKYAASLLAFSALGFVLVFGLQLLQNYLPLNPESMSNVSWDLAFNTAASFVSNTNWQAYAGESTLSYLTQSLGLSVQNFLSAAVGIAVLFALIRGFTAKQQTAIANFWQDLTRVTLYVLIPLSLVLALALVSQGVVQSLGSYVQTASLESGVTQSIPLGPAASQIAIKQLGTNGGGFFGMNSAYPLENPTAFTNLLELLSILLIPAALCVSFGKAVKDAKQGRTIYAVMLIFFVLALAAVTARRNFMPHLSIAVLLPQAIWRAKR